MEALRFEVEEEIEERPSRRSSASRKGSMEH
jgi:hypothetical protein